MDLAKKAGRELTILVGIPTEDVYNAFKTYPDYQNIPSLCELSSDLVTAANSQVWAFPVDPWTSGAGSSQNAHARKEMSGMDLRRSEVY